MTAVGRTQIDPRIRQRRIEVRRESGRKRLRRLVILAAVAVAVVGAVLLSLSPLLDVDRISVSGAQATPTADLIATSGILPGDAMVRLDVDAATEALEAVPWVDTATIRRDFPAAVRIEITERTPVGILRTAQGEALVDASGRVLGPVQLGFGDLPRVEIAGDLPAAGQPLDADARAVLGLLESVGSSIEGRTVVISQSDAGEVSLLVDGSTTVRLGDADRIATKMRSVVTVFDQVDLTCVATIDVRIADRPVLTRDEPCL